MVDNVLAKYAACLTYSKYNCQFYIKIASRNSKNSNIIAPEVTCGEVHTAHHRHTEQT